MMAYALQTGQMGINPIEWLTRSTGEWSLRFLLLSLALSPMRHILSRSWPMKLRRMLGLYAFFYTLLHFVVWSVLDQRFDLLVMWEDITQRPYIAAGFVAFLIMVPLAATSTKGMVRRLKKVWSILHRYVYLASAAAIVHYVWLAKGDRVEPFVYLAALALLYLYRLKRMVLVR